MNREFIKLYYEIYNSEDPEKLREFYCSDVELVSAEGVLNGAEQVLETYRSLTTMFHDKMRPVKIAVQENVAEVEIIDSFTAKKNIDDFMGMKLSKGDSFEFNLRCRYISENNKFKKITIEMI